MLIHNTLDKMAISAIPEGQHEYLHVNSRQAWVKLVTKIIEKRKSKLTKSEIKKLLSHWEEVLLQHYSSLN